MKLFTPRFVKDLILSIVFLTILYFLVHNPITHPIPKPQPLNWSIQLMQHPLLLGLAGHNYLALRDPNGTVIAELHGLATDTTTGQWKYIGNNPNDKLKVWEFDKSTYYLAEKSFPGIILNEGQQDSIIELWKKAVSCKDPINSKNISYPPFGFNLKNETENSNSVAYTLSLCMGLSIKHLGLFTPGNGVNLLDVRP